MVCGPFGSRAGAVAVARTPAGVADGRVCGVSRDVERVAVGTSTRAGAAGSGVAVAAAAGTGVGVVASNASGAIVAVGTTCAGELALRAGRVAWAATVSRGWFDVERSDAVTDCI